MSGNTLIKVHDAWTQYVQRDRLELQHLRSEVANSWQRCRTLRVDPYGQPDGPVDKLELKERLYRNYRLMRMARPFMDNLYNFVRGTGFQVVLTDDRGFLLEVLGDTEILDRTKQVHLCPGGDWSEAAKGTNAIGTAIFERRAVQIHAAEHYCQPNHFLTCSAAPIFDPDGQMLGVLDLSGEHQLANAHTLGMVVSAVGAIENQLRLQRATEKLYLAYRYSNTLLESMSDGLISIDNNGIITEMNSKGGQIFGLNPVITKGRHVRQVFSAQLPVLQLLSDGVAYEDREVVIDKLGKKIRSSASLLRNDSGGVIGAVAVFREIGNRAAPKRPCLPAQCYSFDDIVGDSTAIAAVKSWAKLAAATPSTVLIQGESGTGKELFAQAIHNASARSEHPFLAINCAALPENLIESELFGYEEGAFTGARKGGQPGRFELADGGTLFLDEIGDMSLSVQTKLLRVIQEKKVSRVGSATERAVDIRIIVATHKDLHEEVKQGRFRQDLYYRLHVLELRVPALRQRREDIPCLAQHLADKIARRLNRKTMTIDSDFVAALLSQPWPGNIRELENTIERAMIRAGQASILTPDLLDVPAPPTRAEERPSAPMKSLKEIEAETIRQALAFYRGNIQRTAAKLGIGRNTLYRKIKQHGIAGAVLSA